MKIAVAGTGYVGLSNVVLLAQHNHVVAVDIVQEKVDLINSKKSPIIDTELSQYLAEKKLDLMATTDVSVAYAEADYVVISTPTNYDPDKNFFDTSSVESVIKTVKEVNPLAIIVIKSTIPVGFTERIRKELGVENILFSPSHP
jgi:UDPglucose 6-dehydrogenase